MDVLGSTDQVELNLFRTHMDEERQVRALASGLRVISASDDPSGLAISENLQTQVLGLQQGVQNVQNASNLLDVADSALASVQQILQRIHGLIVEAASDLNSAGDLQDIQAEINTLLQEINKIATHANFNGVSLLDGSHSTSASALFSSPTVQEVTPVDQGTGSNVYDATNSGSPNPGPLAYNVQYQGNTNGFVSGFIEYQIIGYSTNPVDPNFGPLGQPGVYIKSITYSTQSGFGGTGGATEQVSIGAVPTNMGPDFGMGTPQDQGTANNMQNMLQFDINNISPQDVGVVQAFETYDASSSSTTGGTALQVQSGANEGNTVSISLPDVSTTSLGIQNISILDPQTVDGFDNPTGTASSNAYAAADAEGRVQNALDALSQARAQLGAQTVSLQEDANDASVQIVNETASESAIRDLNVGQAVTQFTKDQVMSQIGTSVLAQMKSNAQLVVQLVNGLNPGISGKL